MREAATVCIHASIHARLASAGRPLTGFVVDLGLMYTTDRRQTDRCQTHHRLMPKPRGRGHNIIIVTVMILIERHMVNTSVDYAGDECDNHLLTHNCACIYTNTDCD